MITDSDASAAGKRTSRRRKTAHLKSVPPTLDQRRALRDRCDEIAAGLDKTSPLSKDQMEAICRRLLEERSEPEGYLGWMMVMMASSFWRDQIAAIPPSRRLFLLPHCLKHAEGCPADYDEFGLDCKTCGACSIADFRGMAEEMGYKVLVAEGSPIVLKIIVSGYVDAIVGVACLNVLEKAIDKILAAGIPCMAVPLLSSDCRNTSVDEQWVLDMIKVPHAVATETTRTFVHLMRASSKLFDPEHLERIAPRVRNAPRTDHAGNFDLLADPISATEAIAYDFLTKGGKHSRPFITLAVYDAMTGGQATLPGGEEVVAGWSDGVKRTAMSIETFHKASLVHDDIEDDDRFRYGEEAVHVRFGVPTAINVGDYLVGLGYRLVSRETRSLGSEAVADLIDLLADAHQRLSEGQGAELIWRDGRDKQLKPIDALKIYALKTAPAFEAAFFCGLRLAGEIGPYVEPVRTFARNLGVAFQILNDLKDWSGDVDNKMSAGGDIVGGRPTVLWALALEGLAGAERQELLDLFAIDTGSVSAKLHRVRHLYRQADVFDKAERLVEKHRQRCLAIAEQIQPVELQRLFGYLIEVVLDRPADEAPPVTVKTVSISPPQPINSN